MDPIQGSSFAALMLNICEHLFNLPDEIELIWSMPWRFRFSSCLFIFARYSPYLIHMFNAKYAQAINMSDPMHGYVWFLFKWITTSSMVLVIDFILLKRIYLLYNRQRFIKFFVVILITIRISIMTGMAFLVRNFVRSSLAAASEQKGLTPLSTAVYFGTGELLIQTSILSLTLIKYVTIAFGGRTPLAYRLTRAGIEIPIMSLSALAATLIIGRYSKTAAQSLYALYLTLMSTTGCRLILSTHRHFHLYSVPRAQVVGVQG